MLSEIVHKGCFRNLSPGWCSLVTDLAGIHFPNKADRKVLQNSYGNAGKYHMHFHGADSFRHFLRVNGGKMLKEIQRKSYSH